MYGGGTQNSLRKALGAIKDSTTCQFGKTIFAAISATRPRADVAYCIHALSRRLSKTHNWAVALKTLIVIHRALREVDPTFHEELINYGRSRNHRNHMLNMAHFKDDSSPNAWDYSAWVRTYALFLEERLECFSVLKYDVESERPRTKDLDTPELLEQLPALQQLLFRVLGCQVASESIKIYNAISDGVVNLVDKFFEMQRHDALKALDIYQRSGKQPPASFVQAMEEYVREAPRASTVRKDRGAEDKTATSKTILAIEYKKTSEVQEARPPSPPQPKPEPEPEPEPVKVEAPVVEPPDLLGLNDPVPGASELDEKNALALAIVPIIDQSTPAALTPANGTTGWELALVTAPSSNESATTSTKLGGGLDKLMLDSLYDDAIRRSNQNVSYNPWEPTPMANPMMLQTAHDPFFSSNSVAAPHSVQMAAMANQQQAFMYQQQQQQQQQQMMMMMMSPQQQQPVKSDCMIKVSINLVMNTCSVYGFSSYNGSDALFLDLYGLNALFFQLYAFYVVMWKGSSFVLCEDCVVLI
ncbi:hypothetical protein HYC85_016093 [Camellia sinensis]|uniref:ENTH domain-containing protein n=1 Tax=Camellia sinensis TaxID=4442 RepID=A0A7J7GZY9_CAMSI|nr:hypothetical protein HYC85_016093 [Camellia sinensis]